MNQFQAMQMNPMGMNSGMCMMCGMYLRGKLNVQVLCMDYSDKRFAERA